MHLCASGDSILHVQQPPLQLGYVREDQNGPVKFSQTNILQVVASRRWSPKRHRCRNTHQTKELG